MSKAFTRESDDSPDDLAPPRQVPSLPPGAKNYVTPAGARAMRDELDRLLEESRLRTAAVPDAGAAKRKRHPMDLRIEHLHESLRTAVVVPPPDAPVDKVRFGATVIVRERGGTEARYRVVGVDETDIDRGWVSWLSPVARALTNARVGDKVRLKLPGGDEELEVTCIVFE